MSLKTPVSVGEILEEDYMEPAGISASFLADQIGVSPSTITRILNGKIGLSPEMALKITAVLGGNAEVFLAVDAKYRLWLAQQSVDISQLKRLDLEKMAARVQAGDGFAAVFQGAEQ